MTARRVRVGVLGFFHESNTFAPGAIRLEDVEPRTLTGARILDEHADADTAVSGLVAGAARHGWETVPLTYIEFVPSAPLDAGAAADVIARLRRAVTEHGPFDALLVALHGAAVSTDEPDLDGAVLDALRDAAGDVTLIAAVLDLHANVSPRMAAAADVLVGYRTNPHVDAKERGREAADVVARALAEGIRPRCELVTVPAVMGILAQATAAEPWAGFARAADDARLRPGALSVSLFQGFPWADVPEMGMSVLVVAPVGDPGARAIADHLAEVMWAGRDGFRSQPAAPAAALADSPADATTLLLDVGDNIGAGGTGASTHVLAGAIAAGRRSVVGIVCDRDAAARAHEAGAGAAIELAVGEPALTVRGTVTAISDGRYEDPGPTHVGHRYFDAGPSAALTLEGGQTLVLCSRAILPSSAQQLLSLGVDPRAHEIVIAKGVHSPVAGYRPYIDRIAYADTPGATANDFSALHYRRRRRPLFPLETEHDRAGSPRPATDNERNLRP
ncbi:M81 family metallopeptidase [Microbacterium lushaniae]|nr:M81 family metallopeptidase [Microbacterium lushaniae]KAA9156833.1 M81 family metallopeptidase [Microbacterium lushaniae]